MKKLLAIAIVAVALALPVSAQTNTPPEPPTSGTFSQVLDFVRSGSNWIVAPYGIINTDADKYGVGIGAAYRLSDFVLPTLRLDYYDGRVWMPSGNIQLQVSFNVGQAVVTPLAYAGLATPITGKSGGNFDPVGMAGAGLAVRFTEKWGLIGSVETWTGFSGNQIRFGGYWKF